MDSATESFLETLGELPDITKWTAEEIKDLENFVTTKMAEKKNKAKRLRVLEALTTSIEKETVYKKNILKNVGVSADIVPNDTKILLKHLPVQISATDAQQIRFLKATTKFGNDCMKNFERSEALAAEVGQLNHEFSQIVKNHVQFLKSKAEVENEFKAAKEDKNKLVKKISKFHAEFKNAHPCDEKSKVIDEMTSLAEEIQKLNIKLNSVSADLGLIGDLPVESVSKLKETREKLLVQLIANEEEARRMSAEYDEY